MSGLIATVIDMGNPLITSLGVILLGVITVFGGTRLFTELRWSLKLSREEGSHFHGREALTLPYTIPWLGGFFRMMNPHAMYDFARRKSPGTRPVRLRVGPIGIYILFGSKNVQTIFRSSKSLSKHVSSMMLFRSVGVKGRDYQIMDEEKSGFGSVPLVPMPDDKRMFKIGHDIGTAHLATGPSVNVLTAKFMEEFTLQLDKERKDQSVVVPMFDFLKNAMLVASMNALCGTQMFNLNPGLAKTYFAYEEAFLLLAIGLPRFLYWKGHSARDRMVDACKTWVKAGWKAFDEKDQQADWEKNFGSRFMRENLFNIKNCGVSEDGQASALLVMIWAINSNAIPCAAWVLLEAFQRPGLIQRLRDEVLPSSLVSPTGTLTLDIPKLIANSPLLTSIYLECLRTRLSATVTRELTEDLDCDGYTLKRGNLIMAPSWLPSHDELWDVPGHPARSFWPERFIEMPKLKPENADAKSQFERAMKPDHWFPYGGGGMICTGRFFAKQEILVAVAMMVLNFDLEPLDWVTHEGKKSGRVARTDESYAGTGVLPPDRDLMVRITKIK